MTREELQRRACAELAARGPCSLSELTRRLELSRSAHWTRRLYSEIVLAGLATGGRHGVVALTDEGWRRVVT